MAGGPSPNCRQNRKQMPVMVMSFSTSPRQAAPNLAAVVAHAMNVVAKLVAAFGIANVIATKPTPDAAVLLPNLRRHQSLLKS